jgi:hypothetical protein
MTHLCIQSPSASRRQLVPPAHSPLVLELLHAAAAPVTGLALRPSRHQPLPSAAIQVRAPLTNSIRRVLPSYPEGDLAPFFFIHPRSHQELRFIN